MKKLFKIFSLLIFVVFGFGLTGCAKIASGSVVNRDGSIEEYVNIRFDADVLSDQEISEIKSRARLVAGQIVAGLDEKIFRDSFGKTEEERQIILNFEGKIDVIEDTMGSNYRIGIKFENQDVYDYFYDITRTEDDDQAEIEKHFWYNRYIFKGNTIYLKHNSLFNLMKEEFGTKYAQYLADTELVFEYNTDSRRLHSNADKVVYSAGTYCHKWNLSNNDGEFDIERDVELYYKVANGTNWILVALGSVLVAGIIAVPISILISKKKKA